MSQRIKQSVGLLLGFGILLQIACTSLAAFTGNCPIVVSVSEQENIPPCHKAEKARQAEKSAPSEKNCCEKEMPISLSEAAKQIDWEKFVSIRVLVEYFLPIESLLTAVRFESVFWSGGQTFVPLPSGPERLSILQVFLI